MNLKQINQFQVPETITHLSLSHDGSKLALLTSAHTLFLYDCTSGHHTTYTPPFTPTYQTITWHDGVCLLASANSNVIQITSHPQSTTTTTITTPYTINQILFTPDCQQLLTLAAPPRGFLPKDWYDSPILHLWHIPSATVITSAKIRYLTGSGPLYSISLTPNPQWTQLALKINYIRGDLNRFSLHILPFPHFTDQKYYEHLNGRLFTVCHLSWVDNITLALHLRDWNSAYLTLYEPTPAPPQALFAKISQLFKPSFSPPDGIYNTQPQAQGHFRALYPNTPTSFAAIHAATNHDIITHTSDNHIFSYRDNLPQPQKVPVAATITKTLLSHHAPYLFAGTNDGTIRGYPLTHNLHTPAIALPAHNHPITHLTQATKSPILASASAQNQITICAYT